MREDGISSTVLTELERNYHLREGVTRNDKRNITSNYELN